MNTVANYTGSLNEKEHAFSNIFVSPPFNLLLNAL